MQFSTLALLILTLCTASPFARAADAPSTAPATAPAATSLAGLSFTSVDKMEAGRGGAMSNWKLTFKETKFSWRYSDVVESFNYTITPDGKITATSGMRKNAKLTGSYDAEKKELTWEGKIYKQD